MEEINDNDNIISTSSNTQKIEKININSLPMICLVEIAGFIETDKKCISYRNISKKFNEAVQMKLFMKTKDEDAEFYKKCFMILNPKCHKYYKDNISPLLINADSVYDFFSFNNENVFNNLFNYSFNELKKIIESNKLKLKENLENSFKRTLRRFLVIMIIQNFKSEDYDSLDFRDLKPYRDAREMIILLVKLMKSLKYLDLSNMLVNDDEFLEKLIDKVESRNNFTLLLEGMHISTNIVKSIKMITDRSPGIKIMIDKKYNGQINYLGGKKMNKPQNPNKKKFKNLQFK
jgi:hypothetical protein